MSIRPGPAVSTPPAISSATSVVVMSSTPDEEPRLDQLLHRLPAGAGGMEHHAVVALFERLAHRLHARRGEPEHGQSERGFRLRRRRSLAGPKAIIPASECAALARTFSEMRLMPEMSVTEYIMQMSEGPT